MKTFLRLVEVFSLVWNHWLFSISSWSTQLDTNATHSWTYLQCRGFFSVPQQKYVANFVISSWSLTPTQFQGVKTFFQIPHALGNLVCKVCLRNLLEVLLFLVFLTYLKSIRQTGSSPQVLFEKFCHFARDPCKPGALLNCCCYQVAVILRWHLDLPQLPPSRLAHFLLTPFLSPHFDPCRANRSEAVYEVTPAAWGRR